MSSNEGLYTRLFEMLREFHPEVHVKRIANWVWIIIGLIQSQSIHLSEISDELPGPAKAAGRIARIRRWLSNEKVDVATFYDPLIKRVLQGWKGKAAFIILDGCSVNHAKLQFFRLSLSHCFRALPLAWKTIAKKGLIKVEACAELLEGAAKLLKDTASVTFLADCGFRDKDWAAKCVKLGWNYELRIAKSTLITFADNRRIKVDDLDIQVGRARHFHTWCVRLTAECDWLCNLSVTRLAATPDRPSELCAIATNLRACHQALRDYITRMHIEESFRDDKSGSFDLGATHLTDADRFNHLLLAVAVAVLWIHELGQRLICSGQRDIIDPAYKRQLSVFTIGWRYLRRCINLGSIPLFTLRLTPIRLAPVWTKC